MLPIFPDEKRTAYTMDSSSCAVRSTHHSSESSAVWAGLGLSSTVPLSGITDHRLKSVPQRLYVVQRYRYKILRVPRHWRQLNHEPGLCFFTFRPIYKPQTWPVLFTYFSIDVPPLSPVVLGAESLLRFHRLFSHAVIFNKTNVWGTWIHNFLLILHCHGFLESFEKSVYKLLYFADFWGYIVTYF